MPPMTKLRILTIPVKKLWSVQASYNVFRGVIIFFFLADNIIIFILNNQSSTISHILNMIHWVLYYI